MIRNLVKWGGSGAPVCKEQAQTDSFEETSDNANDNGVKRSFLGNNSSDDLGAC